MTDDPPEITEYRRQQKERKRYYRFAVMETEHAAVVQEYQQLAKWIRLNYKIFEREDR